MYYLLALLLFVLLYYVFTKILSSLIHGCITAVGVFLIIMIVSIFIRSIKEPVSIFGVYQVDKFKVTRSTS